MKSIMVIDDDGAVRTMLRRTLESAGYTVVEAAGGRAALAAVKSAPVDLVISDILMPDMEGIETIRALRRIDPDMKIIAMSGGGQVESDVYLEAAMAFGVARVLSKPFANEELFAAVEAVLES